MAQICWILGTCIDCHVSYGFACCFFGVPCHNRRWPTWVLACEPCFAGAGLCRKRSAKRIWMDLIRKAFEVTLLIGVLAICFTASIFQGNKAMQSHCTIYSLPHDIVCCVVHCKGCSANLFVLILIVLCTSYWFHFGQNLMYGMDRYGCWTQIDRTSFFWISTLALPGLQAKSRSRSRCRSEFTGDAASGPAFWSGPFQMQPFKGWEIMVCIGMNEHFQRWNHSRKWNCVWCVVLGAKRSYSGSNPNVTKQYDLFLQLKEQYATHGGSTNKCKNSLEHAWGLVFFWKCQAVRPIFASSAPGSNVTCKDFLVAASDSFCRPPLRARLMFWARPVFSDFFCVSKSYHSI